MMIRLQQSNLSRLVSSYDGPGGIVIFFFFLVFNGGNKNCLSLGGRAHLKAVSYHLSWGTQG